MAERTIQKTYYVFRADLEGDKHESFYLGDYYPLVDESTGLRHKDLSSLAENLVSHQLNYLQKQCFMVGDEYFPFQFIFTPPYEVKMQRHRLWHTKQLTEKEKREFLDHMQSHYLAECDPISYEQEYPEECSTI